MYVNVIKLQNFCLCLPVCLFYIASNFYVARIHLHPVDQEHSKTAAYCVKGERKQNMSYTYIHKKESD